MASKLLSQLDDTLDRSLLLKRHWDSFKNSLKWVFGTPLHLRIYGFTWSQSYSISLICVLLSAKRSEWLILKWCETDTIQDNLAFPTVLIDEPLINHATFNCWNSHPCPRSLCYSQHRCWCATEPTGIENLADFCRYYRRRYRSLGLATGNRSRPIDMTGDVKW